MPAVAVVGPAGVSCTFSDGSRSVCLLNETVLPELAQELLSGLADLVHPHGDLDKQSSVQGYLTGARFFLRALATLGFAGSAAGLTRVMLAQCFVSMRPQREAQVRAMLRMLDDTDRVLAPDVRRFIDGRALNPALRRHRSTLQPYSEEEWRRLKQTCQEAVRDDYVAFRRALWEADSGGPLRSPAGVRRTFSGP